MMVSSSTQDDGFKQCISAVQCQHLSSMSKRILKLMLWITLAFTSPTESGLDRRECLGPLQRPDKPLGLCLSMNTIQWPSYNEVCNLNDVLRITSIFVHIPNNSNEISSCHSGSNMKFYYGGTYSVSCLMKASSEETEKLLLLVVQGFNNKKCSEVNISTVASEFVNNSLFGLPDFTFVELSYKCLNVEMGIIHYVDICQNGSLIYQGHHELYIVHNMMSYNSTVFSTCSCQIEALQNTSQVIYIRAIDVRLGGDTILRLLGSKTTKILNSSKPLWWETDLLSSSEDVHIELANINPSDPPNSFWLEVTSASDEELSIVCGSHIHQHLDLRESQEISWYFVVVGVTVGLLAFVLLYVVCKRFCKRFQVKTKEYSAVSTKVGNVSTPEQDTSTYKCPDISHVYFEVEPKCEHEQSLSGNVAADSDAETTNDADADNPDTAMASNQADNIYSHLRETTDKTALNVDLYDTVGIDVYSSLQREPAETVIDNIYNK